MPTVMSKSVDFFGADPNQPRKDFPEQELKMLGESLKKRQLVAVIARKNGMLVDGERRWRAAQLVGLKSLDAVLVEDDASEGEIQEIQLVSSLHRADLKPYEVFCGFQGWLKMHPSATAKELAAAIDRSEGYVSKVLSLSRCISMVERAAELGRIGLKDWHAISQAQEHEQVSMLTASLNGVNAEKLKGVVKRPGNRIRVSRVKCPMPSGVCVILTSNGDGLTLDNVIGTLADLLKEAKKANDQGLDSKTFAAVLHDKAKGRE